MTGPGPESLNRGGFAPDVLAAAIHFVGSSDTFGAALDASLLFAGPANYCPVLVGNVARGAIREGLDEESLAIFDLLKKPDLQD